MGRHEIGWVLGAGTQEAHSNHDNFFVCLGSNFCLLNILMLNIALIGRHNSFRSNLKELRFFNLSAYHSEGAFQTFSLPPVFDSVSGGVASDLKINPR